MIRAGIGAYAGTISLSISTRRLASQMSSTISGNKGDSLGRECSTLSGRGSRLKGSANEVSSVPSEDNEF